MSKLPKAHRFVDLSDYGRPVAKIIARSLQHTSITPIQVTLAFTLVGLAAISCILHNYYWSALLFLILKSILDAADGELARIKNTPSHTGRYLDSISDIILNLFILLAVGQVAESPIGLTMLAFMGVQLQGTLYHYFYVILRNRFNGDTTSRVFERNAPTAFPGESQRNVDLLFRTYMLLYGIFDRTIYYLDRKAPVGKLLPGWLMTAVSTFGLGFQLLVIGLMLAFGLKDFIVPFFITYSVFVFVFIGIRRGINC